jgi:tetratricopeptide (TPR) repeat protein
MKRIFSKARVLVFACTWMLAIPSAQAQIDRVYDMKGDNISGAVIGRSKDGVKLDKAGVTKNFKAGEITKIMFEGDPPQLTKARGFALDGQYDQALQELKKLKVNNINRDIIKEEVAFYIALCEAELALSGQGKIDDAARGMIEFAGQNRDSWHFYEAGKLLGDLALASNKSDQALKYYRSLENAPAEATKIEARYLQGLVQLKMKQGAAAVADFDKILGLKPQTTHIVRLQTLSKAGKAVALALQGDGDQADELTNTLIAELNPEDVEIAARIYNARGASCESRDDIEGAIMAYLHTHLMFSVQPDAHAEALKRLVELWPRVGKPERAAQARQELQSRYPGF